MTPVRLGILVGALLSAASYFIYIVALREPGSAFYAFAALAFLGAPLLAGIIAASKAQKNKLGGFFGSSSLVFGIALLLFIVTYAVLPQFDRTSVQLPASCSGYGGVLDLPSQLSYTLPDGKPSILLAESGESVALATIDGDHSPFASTFYLVRKSDKRVLRQMHFNDDVVIASIQAGTVYLYNDKLGYLLNERTGEFENTALLIDNYGGLSESDRPIIGHTSSGNWYLETTAVISNWHIDGGVESRPHLTMNGIARGCYVSGASREIIPLGPHK
jgi:hypothetical protein